MDSEGKKRWKERTAEGAPSEGREGREEREQAGRWASDQRSRAPGDGGPTFRREGSLSILRFLSSENKE